MNDADPRDTDDQRKSAGDLFAPLTVRERDILLGMTAGKSNPEIAADLFVSVNTVKFHVANVLRKLQVSSRLDAAVLVTALRQ